MVSERELPRRGELEKRDKSVRGRFRSRRVSVGFFSVTERHRRMTRTDERTTLGQNPGVRTVDARLGSADVDEARGRSRS